MKVAAIGLGLVVLVVAVGARAQDRDSCMFNAKRQAERSAELAAIVEADQSARKSIRDYSRAEMDALTKSDTVRRKRVAEIFAEGCLRTPDDFGKAALVFQHGMVPEHFYLTAMWARRGLELLDAGASASAWTREELASLMVKALDRYLLATGRKQLFATQASRPLDSPCSCLEPLEPSMPDARRKAAGGRSFEEAMAWIAQLNGQAECEPVQCERELRPTPKGSLPGFW